jgi:hypothetical protein
MEKGTAARFLAFARRMCLPAEKRNRASNPSSKHRDQERLAAPPRNQHNPDDDSASTTGIAARTCARDECEDG